MGTKNIFDDGALTTAIADLDADIVLLQADVDAIRAITDAMSVLTETGGTLTADGTEQNVYINNAPAGLYRPVCVKVDFTNHTATETVVLRVYYRIADGGNMVEQDEVAYAGAQDPDLINIDLEPNRYGVQVTLEKTAGTNRDYPWEVCYET